MTDQPLITITRVVDSEPDPETVGGLDYVIHCQALESWLAAGAARDKPQTVEDRRRAIAAEMRKLADAIEQGASPFSVTCEYAERRAAENRAHVAELRRAEMRSV